MDPEGRQWCGKGGESCSSLQGIPEKNRVFRLWHLKATVLAKPVPKQCSRAVTASWEYCGNTAPLVSESQGLEALLRFLKHLLK